MNRFASRWNFWTRNNSKQHRRWRGKTNNDKGRAKRVPPRVLYDSVFKCLSNYLQCTCEHSLIYKSKESIAHSDLAEKPTISHNLFKPQVSNYSISQQARIVRQVHLPTSALSYKQTRLFIRTLFIHCVYNISVLSDETKHRREEGNFGNGASQECFSTQRHIDGTSSSPLGLQECLKCTYNDGGELSFIFSHDLLS